MSDYDYRNPEDPFQRETAYDPNARTGNSAWGWVAAAVFVAIVLAVVFGMGHQPGENGTNTAMNQTKPPATTQMAPSANPSPTTPSITPANPLPATPATPNPATPAPSNNAQ
jgi:Na+/H+-dicarboxylate symporter